MARTLRHAQSGFSLLEVLVVTAILAGAAYVALDTVEHDSGQIRFETTERRLAEIRRAVVGEPGIYANGSPVVSGFVADLGRVPPCLEALVQQNADCDDDGVDDFTPPAYAVFDGVIAFGWRGPYLATSNSQFFDTWGNTDGNANFAWDVTSTGPLTSVAVASRGRDRATGDPGGEGSYSVDQQMQQIVATDLTVMLDATALNAVVNNTLGTDIGVCIALITPDPADAEADDWTHIVVDGGVSTVAAGTTQTINFSAAGETVSPGMRVFAVYDEAEADVTNCAITAGSEAAVFTAANTSLFPIAIASRLTPTASVSVVVN
ncbi:MAG: prepilin-type N-terminal cleavage/methylation domain-containing protein [Pseudomonadota bacterium]